MFALNYNCHKDVRIDILLCFDGNLFTVDHLYRDIYISTSIKTYKIEKIPMQYIYVKT